MSKKKKAENIKFSNSEFYNHRKAKVIDQLNKLGKRLKTDNIKFSDIKNHLTKIINEKLSEKDAFPGERRGFFIIENFYYLDLNWGLSDVKDTEIKRRYIPVFGVVGLSSKKTYLFPVKALIPELDI